MEKLSGYYIYFTVFVTGAVALGIEILGTRVVAPFYGSTIFVWSSLISVALGFLALGYWIGGIFADRTPSPRLFYGLVFTAGIGTALTVKMSQPILLFSDRFGLQFGPLIASTLLFLLPFFLLGTVTPFAIRLRTKLLTRVGTHSGVIFAVATVGSLVGALLSGFVLLPLLPVSHIFYTMGTLLMVIAALGIALASYWRTAALFLLLGVASLFLPYIKDTGYTATAILRHENSFYGDIKITGSEINPCLYVNGNAQTCMNLEAPQLPLALFSQQTTEIIKKLPAGSKVLVLGLGGGAILASAPSAIPIDSVEIDPVIAQIAQDTFGILPSATRKIIVDDARRFVRKSESASYNVVIEDMVKGAHLPYYIFSRESIGEMQRILKPGGLLVMHIGMNANDGFNPFVGALMKTVAAVFNYADAYSSHPELFSNFVVYAYDEPSAASREARFYHRYDDINTEKARIMTDDFNILDKYFLPQVLASLENARNIGTKLLFSN